MPIPAYMWLKDDGGADIKGSVDVQDREGSIEIVGFSHGLNIPVDSANGKITVSVRRTHIVNAIPLLHADLSKTTNLRQNMAKQYSHSERQQHLHAWQQSGLSKKHYCQQHDLNPATFYYWLKHHRDDDAVTVPAAFIPVRRVMPGNNDADMVTLNLPTGCSVRCLPAQLRAVMQALSLC